MDIGYSETIPAGIRHAVILRDRHCQWAGRCNQPASACQVHHVKHKKDGGATAVQDCVLLCWFHHQVVIHRWGWTLVLNPDGTTTAWNPDKTKILHSHSPPARAGLTTRTTPNRAASWIRSRNLPRSACTEFTVPTLAPITFGAPAGPHIDGRPREPARPQPMEAICAS